VSSGDTTAADVSAVLYDLGLDEDDPITVVFRDTARFLLERGAKREDVESNLRAGTLHSFAWRTVYGPSGTQIPFADVAEAAGMDEPRVRKLLRALGFPESEGALEMSIEDAETLRLFDAAAAFLGEEPVLHLTRVIGSSMARIADAAAATTRVTFETPLLEESTYYDFLVVADAIGKEFFPQLAVLFDRIFRYHVLLISAQDWDTDPEGTAMTLPLAVGFADMVGFTEHAGAASISELARVLDEFEGRVNEAVVDAGGRIVKFIGDEVLFAFSDVAACCECARSLLTLASDQAIRDVRVGVTYGEVISRFGDIYGPVVNTAARLVDVAPPGAILVTPEVAERAGDGFTFEPQEPVNVKGIDRPVENLLLR
jgi:adenylate cyclase